MISVLHILLTYTHNTNMILHQWWIIPKSLTIILTDKSDMVAHGKVSNADSHSFMDYELEKEKLINIILLAYLAISHSDTCVCT